MAGNSRGGGGEETSGYHVQQDSRGGEESADHEPIEHFPFLPRTPGPAVPSLCPPSFSSPSLASPREGRFGEIPRGQESRRKSELGMWWGEDVREIGWEDIGSLQAVIAHEGGGEERKRVLRRVEKTPILLAKWY